MAVFEQHGGTSGGTYASHFTGRLTVNEVSTDITNNTSYVYYKLELVSGSSGRFSGYSASYSVTLNGTQVNSGSGTYASQTYNTAQTICEGYTTIGHNADGSKRIGCSAVLDFSGGTYSPGDFYPGGEMDLSTIPRASSISNVDGNIGSAVNVTINTASSSFRHTVTYSFGNLTGTIKDKTSETSFNWTLPTSFFQQIPRAMSGTGTLTCYTYSGNTHIGTKTSTIIARVPTSGTYNSTPVIDSASVIDTNADTIALTNDNSRLVTYKSDAKVQATGRTLNYGEFSQIKSNNSNMTSSSTSSSGTTTVSANLTHSLTNFSEYKIELNDKRGLYTSKTLKQQNNNFTIVPYVIPTMSLNIERVSPTSDSIKMNFQGVFYNGYYDANNTNFNDLTIKWRYKEAGGNWETAGADDTTNGWRNLTLGTDYQYTQNQNKFASINDIMISNLFNYQKQYVIEVYYADSLSNYTIQKNISQGIPVYDAGVDANGENYFNVNGTIYQNNVPIFNYTSTEQEIGVWIDGKKLYRKTYTGNVVDASSAIQNLFEIDVNYYDIWIDESMSFINSTNETVPLNYYFTTSDFCRTWIRKTDNYVRFKSGVNLSGRTYIITLYYTKNN